MAKPVQAVSADLTSRFARESRYLVRKSSEFEEVTQIYDRSILEISGHEFCYAALRGDNKFVRYVNFLVLRTTITPEFRIMGLWFAVHGNKVEVVKEMMEDLNRPSHFQFDEDTLLKAYSIAKKGGEISSFLLSELQKKGVTAEEANKFRDEHVEKGILEVIIPRFSTMTSEEKSNLLEDYFKINNPFMVDLLIEKGVEIPVSIFRHALDTHNEALLKRLNVVRSTDSLSNLLEYYFKKGDQVSVNKLIEKGVEIPVSMFRHALEKNNENLLKSLQTGRSKFSLISKKSYTDKELLGFVYPDFSEMSEDAKSKLIIRFFEAKNSLMFYLILDNIKVIPKKVLKYVQRAGSKEIFDSLMKRQSAYYVLDKDGKVVTRDSYSITHSIDRNLVTRKESSRCAIFRKGESGGGNIASGTNVFIDGPCLSNKFLRIFAYLGAIFSPYKVAAFTFNEDVKDQPFVRGQVRVSERKTHYCWMHTDDIKSYTKSLGNVPKNSFFKIVSSWVRFKVVLKEPVA